MSFCQLQHCRSLFWQVKPTSYYMLQVRGLHLCLNQSCTLISVKRSEGIRPTKTKCTIYKKNKQTNKKKKLMQHICAAFQTKSKLHHAQLSSATSNLKTSHSCAIARNLLWPTCHLHSCARASSWGLMVPIWIHIKNNLTPLVQTACWLISKGQDDSCVVLGRLRSSFGLFWKIKEADKKHPYVPPITVS